MLKCTTTNKSWQTITEFNVFFSFHFLITTVANTKLPHFSCSNNSKLWYIFVEIMVHCGKEGLLEKAARQQVAFY